MSPPTVVAVLDKLEAKGMAVRYRSTIDRRVVHRYLTEAHELGELRRTFPTPRGQ